MDLNVKNLLSNKEFVRKVIVMSPEDAQKEFAAKGVDVSIDELNAIAVKVKSFLNNSGELSEDELDQVAGGISQRAWAVIIGVAALVPIVVFSW